MKVIKNTLLFGIKIVAAVAAAVHVLRARMRPSNRLAFSVRNNAINHTERRIRMNLDKYPDVLTLRECQKILQVSRGTMLRLLHEGEDPSVSHREPLAHSAKRNARIHRAQRILKTTEMNRSVWAYPCGTRGNPPV